METTEAATYKLVNKIKDGKFDVDNLQNYCLSMQIGIRDFQLCITDTATDTCVMLEDYSLEGVKTINTRLQVLAKLFENHHLLMAGFWKSIKLSLKSHKFSLVPSSHFVEEAVREYLSLNCAINEGIEDEFFYQHRTSNAVNVFAADKRLVSWVKSLYPNKEIKILHQGSALIEGILRYDDHTPEKTLFCIQDKGVLHMFVSENQKLHYYNQFSIKSGKDFLKYLMLVFKEFNMDQRKQKIVLWGSISSQSEQVKMLRKYIRNVVFGSKPSYLKFNYMFDELPEHQYFDLFSIYLCD